jgi:protein PhnA
MVFIVLLNKIPFQQVGLLIPIFIFLLLSKLIGFLELFPDPVKLEINLYLSMKPCPKCESPYGYSMGVELYACPECGNEWNPDEILESDINKILDSNGNELQNGDSVIVIKDLPVKGAPKPIKAGTKVKNIRLNFDSDHNIDCKIDEFGTMALKSEFVRKA